MDSIDALKAAKAENEELKKKLRTAEFFASGRSGLQQEVYETRQKLRRVEAERDALQRKSEKLELECDKLQGLLDSIIVQRDSLLSETGRRGGQIFALEQVIEDAPHDADCGLLFADGAVDYAAAGGHWICNCWKSKLERGDGDG